MFSEELIGVHRVRKKEKIIRAFLRKGKYVQRPCGRRQNSTLIYHDKASVTDEERTRIQISGD